MSGTISATTGVDVGGSESSQAAYIPRITMAQSENDIINSGATSSSSSSPMKWAMPRIMLSGDRDQSGPTLPERIMTAPLPDITDSMLINDPSSLPLSNANR